jgi:hypothetical protein
MVALLLALALLLPLPASAQEEPIPPEVPPPPPLVDEIIPAEPAAPTPEAPEPPRSAEDELIDRAIRYYEQTQQAPPEVGAWLARNPVWGVLGFVVRSLSRPLIWLFLFLLIGFGGRKLLRPLLGARPPDADQARGHARGERPDESPELARRTAVADVIAWVVALAIACEAVGLPWFGSLWSGLMELAVALVGAIVWLGLLITLAALIAWSFSGPGRRLVLSVLGWFYLTRSANRPPEDHAFTLRDGREATILRTDALHSAMRTVDGEETVTVPNAELMEQYFHWAAPEHRREAGRAAGEDA